MAQTDEFYLKKEEPSKSCLLALRHILLELDEAVTETTKYGMPCFCFQSKMFCYLWTDKKTLHPYLLFVEGKHLDHPQLEQGARSRMKIFRINPSEDIPYETLTGLLNQALDLYRSGTLKISN
jgi:hypothetical protein